jgi:hypothetical protein
VRRRVARGLGVCCGGGLGCLVRCTTCACKLISPPSTAKGASPRLGPCSARVQQKRMSAEAPSAPTQQRCCWSASACKCSARTAVYADVRVCARNSGCNAGARAITGAELGAVGAVAAVAGWPGHVCACSRERCAPVHPAPRAAYAFSRALAQRADHGAARRELNHRDECCTWAPTRPKGSWQEAPTRGAGRHEQSRVVTADTPGTMKY